MQNGRVGLGAVSVVAGLLSSAVAMATPSSTVWTNSTTDIQSFRTLHVGVDDYFTVFRKGSAGSGDFPTDVGLTVGVLPSQKFQMEIGIDTLEPSDFPVFLNAKLGTPENTLFKGSPAVTLGIFNVGTESDVTNQNVVDLVAGKSIPGLGRVFVGGYTGNKNLLLDVTGEAEASGFMVAFDRGFSAAHDAGGASFNRFVLAADYASGKNAIGGGGVGLYYYFSPTVSILTGPVFFNERAFNGEWKWTTQLDANLPF